MPRIYEAAAEPAAWQEVLETLAAQLRAVGPGLFLVDRDDPDHPFQVASGIDASWQAQYDAHFHRVDLRRQALQARPAGTVIAGHELVPDEVLLRSEFYQDFLRPQGFFHIAVAQVHKRRGRTGVVRLLRPRNAEPFGAEDLALLRALAPHLGRAMGVHLTLAEARMRWETLAVTLAHIAVGAVALDARARMLYANEEAEVLLDARDGLVLQRGELRAESSGDTAALHALLGQATGGVLAEAGGAMRVRRSSGAPDLSVRVVPVHGAASALGVPRAAAILYVRDPVHSARVTEASLRALFGLTNAEARVARRLVAGRTSPGVAGELGISLETVRSHRKQIFAKVDVHTQAELTQRVLAFHAPITPRKRP